MLGHFDMIAIIIVLLGLVFAGVHIAIALGHYGGTRPLSDDRRD